MWMRMVEKHGSGMRKLNQKELEEEYSAIGRLGETLRELPHSKLRKVAGHRYASVKARPKWKNFLDRENLSWDSLTTRPVCNYAKHHWKHLLVLGLRFCTSIIATLGWGFHIANPKHFVNSITEYSRNLGERVLGVVPELFDLKEFFPNVDQQLLKLAIEAAVEELWRARAELRYL